MLALISPAKKLNYDFDPVINTHTQPDFLVEAEKLAVTARRLSRTKLARTMNLSDTLADLNWHRFQAFHTPFNLENARQAALVFNGDTYLGLDAHSLDEQDLDYAQSRLRILSGLYGLLRPLDLVQPYRLEMGARFKPARRNDLYDFWGTQLSEAINHVIADHAEKTVVNLASSEYFKAVKPKVVDGKLLTIAFKEIKDGNARMIGTFAKQARGMMARYIIQNRIDNAEGMKAFNSGGYKYQPDQSDDGLWTFTRQQPPPPGAVKNPK
ncbi:MAG: peroxide stress protein YaaA [Alphaproteobacteria bacterium]|jgi:uncharacterized protein|nr:peroxide stress protein YaaA [Alphaproteobacteria bacterium]MBT4082221.1 peroxide stress protein YaaA [Alphaproteobacteria bacterium]MBT4544988.1 peroxide stress protein YaaA [Alphaproteobacteria bacterium]MBT7745771.1 peroxide stress protein YaaA [Alphaproteobacteria bacterium]